MKKKSMELIWFPGIYIILMYQLNGLNCTVLFSKLIFFPLAHRNIIGNKFIYHKETISNPLKNHNLFVVNAMSSLSVILILQISLSAIVRPIRRRNLIIFNSSIAHVYT